MDKISEILNGLEKQDIFRVWKSGMPPEMERRIRVLCTEYKNQTPDSRTGLRSAIKQKAGWFILAFVNRMAIVALRANDKSALTDGVIALHLSRITEVDFRDAYEPVARLAFCAKQLGIDLAEWSLAVCPEISSTLVKFMRNPGPVNVGPDADGNLSFRVTPEAEARRACRYEMVKKRPRKKSI
jgi:hypothetical protein